MVGIVVLNCTLYLFLSLLHELNIRKIVDPVVSFPQNKDFQLANVSHMKATHRIFSVIKGDKGPIKT